MYLLQEFFQSQLTLSSENDFLENSLILLQVSIPNVTQSELCSGPVGIEALFEKLPMSLSEGFRVQISNNCISLQVAKVEKKLGCCLNGWRYETYILMRACTWSNAEYCLILLGMFLSLLSKSSKALRIWDDRLIRNKTKYIAIKYLAWHNSTPRCLLECIDLCPWIGKLSPDTYKYN